MAKIDLTNGEQVQGVLPTANGGTGSTSLSGAGIYTQNGANVAVSDGGTAADTAAGALANLAAVGGSNNGTLVSLTLWIGTTAQYTALGSYSSTTVYVCT